jgi:quercetin dioxygenase-like cupin family protein
MSITGSPYPVDDQVLELRAGSFVNIPAHKKHRVAWTAPDEPSQR